MVTVWKIAPGKRADNWEMCQDLGCIVIGWNELGNCLRYRSQAEIVKALKNEYGRGDGTGTGAARTIWRFAREIKPGDVIVANKGESGVVGIGVVEGPYRHPDHPENPVPVPGKDEWWRRHSRRVEWRVKKPVELHKFNFFVASTITRLTLDKCERIKRAYLKEYPELKGALDRLFNDLTTSNDGDDSTLAQDLREIARQKIAATTKKRLVSARVGQGRFRTEVLKLWGNCCAVTGSATQEAIRASHIKPWRESTNKERLDAQNGLPLIASLDALFDAGLISFDPSGNMVISVQMNSEERHIFAIRKESLTKKPTAKMAEYLAYHRASRYQG